MVNKKLQKRIIDTILITLILCCFIYLLFDSYIVFFGVKSININERLINTFINAIHLTPAILIYYLVKRNIQKKGKAFVISIFIYTVPIAILALIEKNHFHHSISQYGEIICPAVVDDKVASSRGGSAHLYIYYTYKGEKKLARVSTSNKKNSFNSIHKGDTVLIRYAVEYRHWNHLYRLHPTKEELDSFRHGRFYFKGKVQDTIPQLPDAPFKRKW